MSKIRILFFINTLLGGGAEKVLTDIVNNMNSEKYDITVQTLVSGGVHYESIAKHIHLKSIINIKNKFMKKIVNYLFNYVISPKLIYKFFIDDKYDYEVAFLEGIPTKLISFSTNKTSKKYAWVHVDLFDLFNGHEKIFRRFEDYRKCYKRYDKIICVSESAKLGFIKRFNINNNVSVVHNVLNEKKILEKSKEKTDNLDYDYDAFKIISVGRLVEQKGYIRLLKVIKRLNETTKRAELWIVGEGDQRAILEKYISDNNISEYVKLIGYDENPYKFMAKADLFVCSSIAEGYSLVVAEALILGIPVVSTLCAGPDYLLENGKYGLITSNNDEGLYDGLKSIIENPEKYAYYKQQADIRSNYFKLEASMKKFEELFL